MEREPISEQRQRASGGGAPHDNQLDQVRSKLEGMLQAADRVLDSIEPVMAEEYLLQSRQRGAE